MVHLLFTSLDFFLFLIGALIVYYIVPNKHRTLVLVVLSYGFYASFGLGYATILLYCTLVTYIGAQVISSKQESKKRFLLLFTILLFIPLILFKYFIFFLSSIGFHSLIDIPFFLKLALPIGISFYTFQSASYLFDVHRGKIPAEKNFMTYAAYVSFFPQLISGPITRAGVLIPQLSARNTTQERTLSGIQLIIWGFFLKLVIADRVGIGVNNIYGNYLAYQGPAFAIATYLFAFQLYGDFAGYTFIAIGVARLFGFELMNNFARPFYAKSISEFWRRWHISLSTWFQDYLFNPLYLFFSSLFRKKNLRSSFVHFASFIIALLIVEVLLGLWHGAQWTFVLFGLYHCIVIFVYYLSRRYFDRLPKIVRIGITFNLVALSFVFFKASSPGAAFYIISHLLEGWTDPFLGGYLGMGRVELGIAFLAIGVMELVHVSKELNLSFWDKLPWYAKVLAYICLVVIILLFGVFDGTRFIYQQF